MFLYSQKHETLEWRSRTTSACGANNNNPRRVRSYRFLLLQHLFRHGYSISHSGSCSAIRKIKNLSQNNTSKSLFFAAKRKRKKRVQRGSSPTRSELRFFNRTLHTLDDILRLQNWRGGWEASGFFTEGFCFFLPPELHDTIIDCGTYCVCKLYPFPVFLVALVRITEFGTYTKMVQNQVQNIHTYIHTV